MPLYQLPFLALAQGSLGPYAIGDVQGEANDTDDAAGGIAAGDFVGPQPPPQAGVFIGSTIFSLGWPDAMTSL